MVSVIITSLQTLNQLVTSGIAITAFSLLLYAFTFNLRDRVARSFALILICIVFVFVGKAIGSAASSPEELLFWLQFQWVGLIFMPAAFLHFSDALLATTGRPVRSQWHILVRLPYVISFVFFLTLLFSVLVGPLVQNVGPAPHLQRTWLTWVFTAYYIIIMVWAWINFLDAHRRTVTRTSRRRMNYLMAGALAPMLGSYQYLLFGSSLAAAHPLLFWLTATASYIFVFIMLVLMSYSVAFFGVPWPDRVVKRRLFKWLMRGPVTALVVLAVTTLVRRFGVQFNMNYLTAVPIIMVAAILVFEHLITLVAPIAERWLFQGGDQGSVHLLQTLEERLLTSGDLRQFLESVLAAVCDRLQVSEAFVVTLEKQGQEMVVTAGGNNFLNKDLSEGILQLVEENGFGHSLFSWGNYWLVPLYEQHDEDGKLIGLLGAAQNPKHAMDEEQREALSLLANRAGLALEERNIQQQVFNSLESLTPQVDMIQRLRAAARYDGTHVLTEPNGALESQDVTRWVKDALTHYWGGPKLTQSPLLNLEIVKRALEEHEGNPANALRAILNMAIEQTRPEGERRFTGEWILYNILEMKFMEGRKVREVAMRLAMSEADLYRKQRVAIEAVAAAIVEMEEKARENEN